MWWRLLRLNPLILPWKAISWCFGTGERKEVTYCQLRKTHQSRITKRELRIWNIGFFAGFFLFFLPTEVKPKSSRLFCSIASKVLCFSVYNLYCIVLYSIYLLDNFVYSFHTLKGHIYLFLFPFTLIQRQRQIQIQIQIQKTIDISISIYRHLSPLSYPIPPLSYHHILT